MKKKSKKVINSILCFSAVLGYFGYFNTDAREFILNKFNKLNKDNNITNYDVSNIPEYSGKPYVFINESKPIFSDTDYIKESIEKYSDLDLLGRCGVAFANIGRDLMPTEDRGSIGMIKPTGWHTIKYDNIDGKYLYNRCHLIGYQLTGENANDKNLITCTRSMNAIGMLEFENEVANYVKESNDHVLYRVTPVFENNNLLAKGVQIEASSVSDKCGSICFNVFVYNVQDGITIDYKTGDSVKTN